jgi:2-amino-4-hydroxy-6-hydroxymethyldihydropteridine diphosphokinase
MIQTVYVALGGNIGNTPAIFTKALQLIYNLKVTNLQTSHLYLTTPVSDLKIPHFYNAVCKFDTKLDAFSLLHQLQKIEKEIGKIEKTKNESRIIDLDILFFGNTTIQKQELTIPHPRWMERLFVLVPLSDLTSNILEFHLSSLIQTFTNPNNETVLLWKE